MLRLQVSSNTLVSHFFQSLSVVPDTRANSVCFAVDLQGVHVDHLGQVENRREDERVVEHVSSHLDAEMVKAIEQGDQVEGRNEEQEQVECQEAVTPVEDDKDDEDEKVSSEPNEEVGDEDGEDEDEDSDHDVAKEVEQIFSTSPQCRKTTSGVWPSRVSCISSTPTIYVSTNYCTFCSNLHPCREMRNWVGTLTWNWRIRRKMMVT